MNKEQKQEGNNDNLLFINSLNKLIMRKKLFTLMTLLLCAVTGAWANQTDLISGFTLPDIPTSTLNLASQTEYTADANGWIVSTGLKGVIDSKTWHSKMSTDGGQTTWTVPEGTVAPFIGSTDDAKLSRYTVRSGARNHAIRFTGAEKASFLVSRNSDTRKATVSVFSYDGTTQTLIGTKSMSSGSIGELLFEDLSTSVTYIAYIYGTDASNNSDWYEFALKAPVNTAAVTGYQLDGVKINGAVATENTDYTISGTTITLAGSYITAPTVALVEKTVYESGDPNTEDVNVTLTKNATGDYFEGTATIGKETLAKTYTVKAPVNTTATLEADVTALTVSSPTLVTGKATFNLTGANLTAGATISLAFASSVDGLTVSPASITVASDGTVAEEVTVSYQSSSAVSEANVNLVITVAGIDNITIPVTYSSTAGVTTITDVTESTIWDWTGAASAAIESPDANNVIPLANASGWVSTFNAAALAGKGQYFYYGSNNCYQGSVLKFHTTVAGTVTVVYSNTGNRDDAADNYRYLYINGSKDANDNGSISAGNTTNTVSNFAVDAGDVILEGFQGDGTSTPNMLRIYSVEFTAAGSTTTVGVTGVTLDKSAISLEVGESQTLVATVAPEDATDQSISWTSSDDNVATVDVNGKVTAVAAGTANITVTTEDGSFTDVCVVTVTAVEAAAAPTLKLHENGACLIADTDDETHYTLDATNIKQVKLRLNAQPNTFITWAVGEDELPEAPTLTSEKNKKDNTSSSSIGETGNILTISNSTEGFAKTYYIRAIAWNANKAAGSAKEVIFTITGAKAVTLSEYEWATFVSDKALDFTDSQVKAYIVTGDNGSAIVKSEPLTKVAAGTALLLNGAEGSYSVPVATEGTDYTDTNCLKAGEDAEVAAGTTTDKYMLTVRNNKAAFAIISDSYSPTITSDKAYLELPKAAGARDFFFLEGDATGISVMEKAQQANGEFYNLNGQRVAQPTKGLYIVNGKKYIVK